MTERKTKTTWRNPPSTGYEKPAERKFYIWRHRYMSSYPWLWMCTFCEPPSRGWHNKGGWEGIMYGSMPRHFERRRAHHRWVASHKT